MELVSIIIPSRAEKYLNNTINDLLKNARGDIEIIVILDGPHVEELIKDERVRYIENETPKGMRNAINTGVAEAQGKYIMKCDAHCCFDEGFDVKLKEHCKENWVVVPRRYAIDKNNWTKHPNPRYFYDFQYIGHPDEPHYKFKGVDWADYGVRVKGKKIVSLMTSQGSCWFMYKSWFEYIGGLDEVNYGTMGAEAQETCLKTWLGGGKYVLNRNTWYAHKKKRDGKRGTDYGYKKPGNEWRKSRAYVKECFLNNKWDKQVRSLDWLINKFKPIPGWHTTMDKVISDRVIQEKFKLNYAVNTLPIKIDGLNRDGMVQLWKELGYRVGAEIGVDKGHFSCLMFQNIPELKMYLVDPYSDYKDIARHVRRRPEAKEMAHTIMKGYDVTWIEDMSENAFNQVPDGSLDFVYIDGNHRYDYVMLDIILWQRKVRKGGMVSGHDYNTRNRRSKRDIAVAVDDYTEFHKITPWYITDNQARVYRSDRHASWFWIK